MTTIQTANGLSSHVSASTRRIAMSITDYIQKDLKARIQADAGMPERPTLKSLATHYRVSLTPVRLALEELVEQKWILKRPNGRLMINPRRVGVGKPHVLPPPPAPREDWDRVITDDVIRLSFQGREVFLREEATARKYGISRTVVRQVFHRLAGSGIFDHQPRRGWRVRPFRHEDVVAFARVREAMELTALETAWPHLQRADLERMLAEMPPSGSGRRPLDDSLHKYLIEKSGNRYIQDFFRQYASHYNYRTFFKLEEDEEEIAAALSHHRRILEALLAGDRPRASALLSEHIRHQVPALEKMINTVLSKGADRETGLVAADIRPGDEA